MNKELNKQINQEIKKRWKEKSKKLLWGITIIMIIVSIPLILQFFQRDIAYNLGGIIGIIAAICFPWAIRKSIFYYSERTKIKKEIIKKRGDKLISSLVSKKY